MLASDSSEQIGGSATEAGHYEAQSNIVFRGLVDIAESELT